MAQRVTKLGHISGAKQRKRGIGQGRGYWCAVIPYFETRSLERLLISYSCWCCRMVNLWLMVMMLLFGGIMLIKVEAGDKGAVTRGDWWKI